MKILDGKAVANEITADLKNKISELEKPPRLDIIIVGEDFASQKYVSMKEQKAKEIGMLGEIHRFNDNASREKIISKIEELNSNDDITGFMVQLPLPREIDQQEVTNHIHFSKDVDGLSAYSLGLLFQQRPSFVSATPKGVMRLLTHYNITIEGTNSVIIGKSAIVGAPLSALLTQAGSTVTICHSRTQNLAGVCSKADILISATGKAELVTKEFVKKDAVVIDVGTSKHPQTGKLSGDVKFDEVKDIASFITPVPGGVGPMTISMLLENTYEKAINKIKF